MEEKRVGANYQDAKQAQNVSALTTTSYQAPPKPEDAPKPTPAKGKTAAENVKLQFLTS